MASSAPVAPSDTLGGGNVGRSRRLPLPLALRIGTADRLRAPGLTR